MVQAGRYNTYGREISGTGKRKHMYRYRRRDQLYKNEVISTDGILLTLFHAALGLLAQAHYVLTPHKEDQF
jgi:hypothetical protein